MVSQQEQKREIIWHGLEYDSFEHCTVQTTDMGTIIRSSIRGAVMEKIFWITYRIELNPAWETVQFEIRCVYAGNFQQWEFQRAERQGFTGRVYTSQSDTERDPESFALHQDTVITEYAFKGAIDIDIPLTPLTNTLPIRRLQMATGDQSLISVLYCDLFAKKISILRQKYVRVAARQYHYENVPNDFETIFTVDGEGFVVDYPGLFRLQQV